MAISQFNDGLKVNHWSKKLFRASFKGIHFEVKRHNMSGGRRGPDHQFPGRDKPYAEDTGRRQEVFIIDAFVIGGERIKSSLSTDEVRSAEDIDYSIKRDALLEACRNKGAGTLKHPYLGTMRVICRNFKMSESFDNGRMASFSMTFVEEGTQRGISIVSSPADGIHSAGQKLRNEMSSAMGAKIISAKVSTAGKLSFVEFIDASMDSIDNGLNKINSVIDSVQNVRRSAEARIRRFNTFIAQASFAVRKIGQFANDLISFPDQIAEEFQSNIELLQNAGASAKSAYENLFAVIGFSDDIDDSSVITASRTYESRNNRLMAVYMDTILVTSISDFATAIPYTSREEAILTRDQLLDRIDILIGIISDDLANPLVDDTGVLGADSVFSEYMYSLMRELRAQIGSLLPDEVVDVPNIISFNVKQCESGLVSSYRQTGTVTGYADLVSRNNLVSPSALTVGLELQVLLDA